MSRNEFDRLFEQLEMLSVGFGPIFKEFKIQTNYSTNYPPHNIVQVNDNEFSIELAVAGFKKSEVKMEEHQGLLTITGEKKTDSDESQQYRYRGIAGRSFVKKFRLADFFEVSSATMEDGILTIKFVKNVPEQDRPKLIAID